MKSYLISCVVMLSACPVLAQSGPPSTPSQEVMVSTAPVDSAEVKALRAAAKPLLDHIKANSGEMAALKRKHAEEKRRLRAQGGAEGTSNQKHRKAATELLRAQREEFRRSLDARKAEHRKFEKKNPAAKKALDELIRRGIPVEETAAGQVPGK